MENWIYVLVGSTAFMAGFIVCLAVVLVVGRSWMGLKPPKPVAEIPAPVTVVSKPDPPLHQATATKPQPVVKSA